MNKQAVTDSLTEKYTAFTAYINSLSPQEYVYSYRQKWNAGQQLEHIVLSVKPLVQVFGLDAAGIEKNFGRSNKGSRTYDELLSEYKEKLTEGGKAPTRYVPEAGAAAEKELLIAALTKMITELNVKIEKFTEEELDALLLPHPLLGNITLREMLYNAIYHVQHHGALAKEYLVFSN